jgi:hypothetical protein
MARLILPERGRLMLWLFARARRASVLATVATAVALILSSAALMPVNAALETPSGGLSNSVSLQVLAPTPGEVVTTPTLALDVIAVGYKLDAAFAGTPNLAHIGHYHEILDGQLVDMTPLDNPNTDTVSMVDVAPGPHVLTLVPANNDHSMIMSAAVNIPFTYAGPFLPPPSPIVFPNPPGVAISSPANGATVTGSSFSMTVSLNNFELCGTCFGKDSITGVGHWHIFLDQPVMSHMLTMASDTTQTVSLKAITPGWHTFYAALVNDQHMPFMGVPSTMAAVTLYVAAGS